MEPVTDIARLMAADPLSQSDKDFDEIIAYYRSQRHAFNAGNMKAGKKPTAKENETLSVAGSLNLKDLLK